MTCVCTFIKSIENNPLKILIIPINMTSFVVPKVHETFYQIHRIRIRCWFITLFCIIRIINRYSLSYIDYYGLVKFNILTLSLIYHVADVMKIITGKKVKDVNYIDYWCTLRLGSAFIISIFQTTST